MRTLPTGTITLLFTDIEGSTKLWEGHPDIMRKALVRHDVLATSVIEQYKGQLVKSRGEGDSLFAVFSSARDAVAAAYSLQRAFLAEPWPPETPIRVRMALHTGEADLQENDYYGPAVNRCARLRAIAHGGQILLSQTTKEIVAHDLLQRATLKDLGEHRLRDLAKPERVFQLLHPELPGDFPHLKSLDTFPNNLPYQLTSFIGRESEMKEIKDLLRSARLLALLGAGGCGKTRLALQVAADLLEEYPDGIWIVELAPLSDPGLIAQRVASIIGVREESNNSMADEREQLGLVESRTIWKKLTDFLHSKRLLLLIDNCEHMIEDSARFTESLLQSCPYLCILATSREALGIRGESTYRVPPLSLPDPHQPLSVEQLAQYESVKLLVDRATAAWPDFKLTGSNADAVAHICRRLDGIPLAIELAASRVRALSVEEIAARLDDRFRLLTGGSRTALPRQQTLKALLDWSYSLLSEKEQVFLRRLSVFAGGWTLEAVEAICSDEIIARGEVLDLLTHLVDKSLVLFEERNGQPRYRTLETVRQYSQDRLLESGEAEIVRRRHRDCYLELAEWMEPELWSSVQEVWLDQLETEHDNLRAAMEWSLVDHEAEKAVRLAGALWWFWYVRGYWSEGRDWLSQVLEKSESTSTFSRAKALQGAGVLSWRQGDYEQAKALCEAGLTLFRELGDTKGVAFSLNTLGLVARDQGHYKRALELLEESLSLFREAEDKHGIALSLYVLGRVAWRQKEYRRAGVLCQESLALSQELGYKRGMAYSLDILGRVAWDQGNDRQAQQLCEESLMLFRELGEKQGIAHSLRRLGLIARHQGDFQRATALSRDGLSLFWELGEKLGIAECLEELACVNVAQGSWKRAAHFFGAAQALRQAIGAPLPPDERSLCAREIAVTRTQLGEDLFSAAWAHGWSMALDQTVQYALSDSE
jgi:predicted ATPase/class 3 adenylate cyclase